MSKKFWVLLLFSTIFLNPNSLAQENQSDNKFILGALMSGGTRTNDSVHSTFRSLGLNTIVEHAGSNNQNLLSYYDVIPYNQDSEEWIHFYATGLYSKWEAEENVDTLDVGMKHSFGDTTTYNDTTCWYVSNLSGPRDSILYGPHYRQWKMYKRWDGTEQLNFIARYNMALEDNSQSPPNTEVCKITVKVRHARIINGRWDHTVWDDTLYPSVILKVSDFDPYGHFKSIYFSTNPDSLTYNYNSYPPNLDECKMVPLMNIPEITWSDSDTDNGVQFCLEWLGNNQMTLYIDNVEVYDANGWNHYIDPAEHDIVINNIINYANEFPRSEWPNIKYWYAQDEPSSRDAFIPMRTVDEILKSVNAAPLITHYYAGGLINGEDLLEKFSQIAQPKKLLIDYYPFSSDYPVLRWQDLDGARERFQKASELDSTFFYTPQAFGNWKIPDGPWSVWRRPDTSEFKAPIMLSLAHGAKGLIFSDYDSYPVNSGTEIDSTIVGGPPDFEKQDLWYVIKNNLVARLGGKLGIRLLSLKYTGDYIKAQYFVPTDDPSNQTYEYLTLPYYQAATTMNWHAGFFNRDEHSDDKYFFLVNLLPNTQKSVRVKVTPPVTGFYNYRFRNYEGQFDTTFYTGSSLTYILSHPAGEGYLYEVAPVVKYGGKLYHDEVINNSIILNDNMTIENGVILTVNNNYTCKGNIYLKGNATIRTTGNGHITLESGKAIILLQPAVLGGTQSHPLVISSSTDSNSVVVTSPGGLTANYCSFVNGRNGIKVYGDSGSINITHCSFEGHSNAGVMFSGRLTASPKVRYSDFENNAAGIWAINVNDLVVQHNTFTDNVYDVKLNLATNVQVVTNNMSSSNYEGQGVLATSSTGYIRQNQISGHLNGIYLGNSPMNIGGNTIYHNARHGIYVGTGSVPDLRGYLVQIPCNNPPLYYALRGYNTIYENGMAGQNGVDNDGSEIYISYASILMNTQCNDISDDREPDPSFSVQNLMGGILMNDGVLNVENQGWGYNPRYPDLSQRFGNLNVDYDPYWPACPLIDQPINCGYVVYATDKTVIDTLYPVAEQQDQKDNLDLMLIEADEYYNNGEYALAEPVYTEIINNYPSDQRAIKAYTQLYALKKVTDTTGTNFSALKTLLESKLPSLADSMVHKVVSQLSVLCQVANSDYIPAISTFDEIAEQNTGTEEGLFAEIDALTTAIISYNQGGGLQKGLPGKYQANSEDELLSKLNKIMEENFGSSNKKNEIIPTEYSLYSNYPNPFNPTTVIRFDIPERTNVELVVYDILGRRVKSLVNNELRNPGRYEVSFNANALASGVYIYKLTTKNYSQARKMLLVK